MKNILISVFCAIFFFSVCSAGWAQNSDPIPDVTEWKLVHSMSWDSEMEYLGKFHLGRVATYQESYGNGFRIGRTLEFLEGRGMLLQAWWTEDGNPNPHVRIAVKNDEGVLVDITFGAIGFRTKTDPSGKKIESIEVLVAFKGAPPRKVRTVTFDPPLSPEE